VAKRSPAPKPTRTPEEQADLRRRAEAYDVEALSELTDLHHDIDDIGIDEGDLGARAERAVIQLATTTLADEAALVRYLAQMRTELDGPAPSPIERLLVDRVVTCWVHLNYLGELWARSFKEDSIAIQKLLEHLLDGANRRYLSALKTLAQVRRLIVPVVQLNMANQQVNVVVGSSDG
jgi:uncharacterized protein YjiS (DUF1127 family)